MILSVGSEWDEPIHSGMVPIRSFNVRSNASAQAQSIFNSIKWNFLLLPLCSEHVLKRFILFLVVPFMTRDQIGIMDQRADSHGYWTEWIERNKLIGRTSLCLCCQIMSDKFFCKSLPIYGTAIGRIMLKQLAGKQTVHSYTFARVHCVCTRLYYFAHCEFKIRKWYRK